MNILKLAAQLTLDGRNFKAGIREATKATKDFQRDLTGGLKGEIASVFGAGALIAFTKESLRTVSSIKDLSEQTNATTNEVQRLTASAEELGLGFSDVQAAILKLGAARKSAAEGNQEERDNFAKFGITLKDLQNPMLRNVDLFMMLGRAVSEMPRTAALDEYMREFLGKTGPKLVELLKTMAEIKIDPISKESIDRIDKAAKQFERQKRSAMAFVASFFSGEWANIQDAWKEKNPFLLANPMGGWKEVKRTFSGAKDGSYGVTGGWGDEDMAPLYEDKEKAKQIKAQELSEIKSQVALEEALLKLRLASVSASEQKLIKERQIGEQMARIRLYEFEGAPLDIINAEKAKLANMAADSMGVKSSPLEVSQLTAQGQFVTGRNMIVAGGDNPVAKAVLDLLTPAKETAAAAKGTLDELKKNPPIRLAR